MRPARIEDLRRQAFALACLFLFQFAVESLGGALRTATPFDDICSVSTSRAGEQSGAPGGLALHGQHCALCASASALAPPPLPCALPGHHHVDAADTRAIEPQHRIASGAHWHSRAPPSFS
jgi:hypothetical protein